jgi:hypothetical protein
MEVLHASSSLQVSCPALALPRGSPAPLRFQPGRLRTIDSQDGSVATPPTATRRRPNRAASASRQRNRSAQAAIGGHSESFALLAARTVLP